MPPIRSNGASCLWLALALAGLAPAPTAATDYFVRLIGSDANPGTSPALAWRTIQHGADTMVAGDTVHVGAGTYNENLDSQRDGTAVAPISFIADTSGAQTGDAGTVTIDATGDAVTVVHRYHLFRGFRLLATSDGLSADNADGLVLDQLDVVSAGDDGIDLDRTDGTITNCVVTGANASGIEMTGSSTVAVSGATVTNSGGDGIFGQDVVLTVTDSAVSGSQRNGIEAGLTGSLVVSNITIDTSSQDGINSYDIPVVVTDVTITTTGGAGIELRDSSSAVLEDLQIAGASGRGIDSQDSATDVTRATIATTGREGIYASGSGTLRIFASTLQDAGSEGIETRGVDLAIVGTSVLRSASEGVDVSRAATLSIHETLILTTGGEGVSIDRTPIASLVNVLISDASQEGVEISHSSTTANLWHVTVVGSGREGIRQNDGTLFLTNSIVANNAQEGLERRHGVMTHSYNLFWNNAGGDFNGTSAGLGELFANPQFVGASDFHLTSGSPAVDQATDASATTVQDLDGAGRPVGSAYDMGAYELQAAIGVDHFALVHDGAGIYCLAETLTVTALDASDNPVLDYTGAVTLDTGTSRGTWTGDAANQGTFADPTPDDGLATYTFSDADDGVAIFLLAYAQGNTPVDLEVFETATPTVRDDDAEGTLAWAPSGFVVTGGPISNPPPPVISSPVATQTAGTDFPIYLTAYGQTPTDPTCGVIETYSGARTLQFWSDYRDPTSGTRVPTVGGSPVGASEATATSISLTFSSGQTSFLAKYKDVGQIALAMKDTGVAEPAAGIRGATNDFVVRPDDLEIVWVRRPDDIANPAVSVPTGTVFVAAGSAFKVRVHALDAEDAPTPNFGLEAVGEGLRLTATTLVAPSGGRNGTSGTGVILNATAFSAVGGSPGSFEGASFGWDEVGAIRLTATLADSSYLGTGPVTGTESGTVGRFTPADFAISASAPSLATQCLGGAFTYVGQDFDYVPGSEPSIDFTAQNAQGGTTENYVGSWFRLGPGDLTGLSYSAASGTLNVTAPNPPSVGDLGAGLGRISFDQGPALSFQRGGPLAPFDADLSLAFNLLDADAVAYASNPVRFALATPGNGMAWNGGKQQRSGRMRFSNAHGSELLALPVPFEAEFWNGSSFVANTADSCTPLSTVNLTLTPVPGSLSSSPTLPFSPLVGGNSGLTLSSPGAGVTGHVDLVFDLTSATGADLPWLLGDWDGDGLHLESPSARATFGIYAGSGRMIFVRDAY